MKKYLSYIILIVFIFQIILDKGMFFDTYALTDSYDFNDMSSFSISDTDKAYIHGWSAKLKWSLTHRAHIENWPAAMDWATNVVVDGDYAYVSWYWSHAITSIDISDPTNMSAAWYIWADDTRRLWGAYDLKKVWNYIYVASYIDDDLQIIDATDPTNLSHEWRFVDTGTSRMNWARGIDVVWNYAYIAAYNDDALQIIDISDPANPVERWSLRDTTRLNGAMSVKVVWNYAYVTTYINDSLQIIDISDPDTLFFAAELVDDTITELNWAWWIDIVWDFAYISWYVDDGLEIVDISTPTAPMHVGEIQNSDPGIFLNWAREVRISWNYAYISAYADDSLQIIDISNPSNPTYAGAIDTNSFGRLDAAFWVAVDGTDVYMTSYTNGTLQSIDTSTIWTPVFQDELYSGPFRLWNAVWVKVEWDYAYIASYWSNGVEIMNISDSANPIHVSSITDDSTNNELFWSWDLEKSGDYLYVSWYSDNGIEIIDVSDPVSPTSVARLLDSGTTVELQNPRGLSISGNFLYVISYNWDALQIIDISIPSSPVARWNFKSSTYLNGGQDIIVSWNYAFVTSYIGDSITVIDISNPDTPTFVTEIEDITGRELNWAWDITLDGDYIYVSSYIDDAVIVLDISDPINPVYRWDFDDTWSTRLNWPRWIVYDEWYAYVSTYIDDSLVTIDVSDPDNLLFIDEIRNTVLYERSSKIDKKENDIFFTQYVGSSLSVARESYPNDSPHIIPDSSINSNFFNSINITYGDYNEWNVSFQLSKDNGTTWYYFNGSSWQITNWGTAQSNDVTTLNNNISWFNALTGTDEIKWKAFLNSNWEQKVELDQVTIDYFDSTPPIINDLSPSENSLLPKHDFNIRFDYFDVDGGYGGWSITENNGGVGIEINPWNTSSGSNISLYKWGGSSWGNNIADQYIDFVNTDFGTGSVTYPTLNIPYWKYRMDFYVNDLNGNTSSTWAIFYIDEPEIIVWSWAIDVGTINHLTNTFSDTLSIEVLTVWAPFNLNFTLSSTLDYVTESIQSWDGNIGLWYQQSPYNNTLSVINSNQPLASESLLINTNGNKNSYVYDIQVWAIIEALQAGWDYIWDLKFDIDFQY